MTMANASVNARPHTITFVAPGLLVINSEAADINSSIFIAASPLLVSVELGVDDVKS
jgi:hypothetical protein